MNTRSMYATHLLQPVHDLNHSSVYYLAGLAMSIAPNRSATNIRPSIMGVDISRLGLRKEGSTEGGGRRVVIKCSKVINMFKSED